MTSSLSSGRPARPGYDPTPWNTLRGRKMLHPASIGGLGGRGIPVRQGLLIQDQGDPILVP
jgi:hypothetical protein